MCNARQSGFTSQQIPIHLVVRCQQAQDENTVTHGSSWRCRVRPAVSAFHTRCGLLEHPAGWSVQMQEVVAYAAARHIEVVPEVEMPGHCGAALASYPQLSCAPLSSAPRSRVPAT